MIYMIRNSRLGEGIEVYHASHMDRVQDMRVHTFIDAWCIQYGSTMEGRRVSCAKLLGIQQKVPILISQRTKDIVFPTCNIRKDSCVWLNYRFIDYVKRMDQKTIVYFVHGASVTLDVDIRVIQRGMRLCKEYFEVLQSSCI